MKSSNRGAQMYKYLCCPALHPVPLIPVHKECLKHILFLENSNMVAQQTPKPHCTPKSIAGTPIYVHNHTAVG